MMTRTEIDTRTVAPRWIRGCILSLTIVGIMLMTGCGTIPKRTPLPEGLSNNAKIAGIPRARAWGDEPFSWMDEFYEASQEELQTRFPGIYGKDHNYLAISGGGSNGAFTAGLLLGWTEAGTRPEFTVVTGISTGALIAPFAFLGPDYDATLKEIYTGITTEDILTERGFWSGFYGLQSDALADTKPLQKLLKKYFTSEVMEAIAEEYRKGRQLDIGTTNLDAGRPVIWSIGRIAVSGHPKALDLIRDLLLASASIPVAFPPVLVEVEANGQVYDEAHVDGGGSTQIFMYPVGLDFGRALNKLEVKSRPNVYLIRNSQIKPKYSEVELGIANIAGRTIDSLIRTQGIGDIYRMYYQTKRDGLSYHLAYIPDDFKENSKEPFDKEYMGKLFDLGYRLAKDGYPWEKYPSGAEVE
jgi:hypothetical protein